MKQNTIKIGYELEFFAVDKNSFDPISRQQFLDFHHLLSEEGWENIYDPITSALVYSEKDGVAIKTDDSIAIFELILPPSETIWQSDALSKEMFSLISAKLEQVGAMTLHFGTYPKETTCTRDDFVTYQNYYRSVDRRWKEPWIYFFTAGDHIWLDIEPKKFVQSINVFNQLAGVFSAFFGNSSIFKSEVMDVVDYRAELTKRLVLSGLPCDIDSHGMLPQPLKSFASYLDERLQLIFFTMFGTVNPTFYPVDGELSYKDFFASKTVECIDTAGVVFTHVPDISDFVSVQKAGFWEVRPRYAFKKEFSVDDILTYVSTENEEALIGALESTFLELRYIGAQKVEEISVAPALALGFLANMEETKSYLEKKQYNFWQQFRLEAIASGISPNNEQTLKDLLKLSIEGLKSRNQDEETLLEILTERISMGKNPGQLAKEIFESSGLAGLCEMFS